MGRPKKIKIEEVSQIHGKQETFKPTTLDQIWGDTGMSKYRTMDEDAYFSQINGMSKSDLQSHAMKLGVMAIDDTDRLRKRLMQEFRTHVLSYRNVPKNLTEKQEISPEVAKILAEGR